MNEDESYDEAFESMDWLLDADPEAMEEYIDRTRFQARVNALEDEMAGALLGDSGPVPYRRLLREKELWDFAALKLRREITEEEVERLISLCRLIIGRYRTEARHRKAPTDMKTLYRRRPLGASCNECERASR